MEMLTAPAVLALTAKRAADAAKADPIVNVFIIRTPVVRFHIQPHPSIAALLLQGSYCQH
jgi:hypothetical protein